MGGHANQGNENKERVGGKIITPTLLYVYGGGYRYYGMVSYFNKSIFRKARYSPALNS